VVDWFEDRTTAALVFTRVLGHTVREMGSLERLREGPLRRRAARVLENSGPVPWAEKHDVLEVAATVPELHHAVFRALLTARNDYYGDVEPAAALGILERLDLPPGTGDDLREALDNEITRVDVTETSERH
jgi:hypothetical protein